MPNVLIRDLPPDVHAELARRASTRGQSLQQFLSAELTRLAETPTLESFLADVGRRASGRLGFEQAVEDLDAGRER